MECASLEDVWPKIEWIINNKTNIEYNLGKVVPSLKEKSTYGVKEAVNLLQLK
jgi:hypothetical protein